MPQYKYLVRLSKNGGEWDSEEGEDLFVESKEERRKRRVRAVRGRRRRIGEVDLSLGLEVLENAIEVREI